MFYNIDLKGNLNIIHWAGIESLLLEAGESKAGFLQTAGHSTFIV